MFSDVFVLIASSVGFFAIGKSDRSVRSDRNIIQFLRIITIYLEFKYKGCLIFPVLAGYIVK